MLNKIIKYIKNPALLYVNLSYLGFFKNVPDEQHLKRMYKAIFNKKLDLSNPLTFNEKLQWLKLYDRKEEYKNLVDKFEVKKYVADAIGEEYIIPTIDICDSFDEINFDNLPEQFVIKCTHDSGGIVICKNKKSLDINSARKIINRSLKKNYYIYGREWPYKYVKPRIIIEKYMIEKDLDELRDYKFFCFNGKVKFFKVDFDRFIEHRANYFSIEGKILPFGEKICPPDFEKKLALPSNINDMLKLAEKLSKNFIFIRVDFYNINKKIYFGEMTFYPASGFGEFVPQEWDRKLGDMIKLPFK